MAAQARALDLAERIIATLPDMRLRRMHAIWDNARSRLERGPSHHLAAAGLVVEAIAAERARRGPEGHSVGGDDPFRWPSTEVTPAGGPPMVMVAPPEGMLAAAGYHVGRVRGEPERRRRAVLETLFKGALLDLGPEEAKAWGEPDTSQRLRKLAHTIAALTRTAKQRGAAMHQAISDWEADLHWLKERFYLGRFDFPWPRAA